MTDHVMGPTTLFRQTTGAARSALHHSLDRLRTGRAARRAAAARRARVRALHDEIARLPVDIALDLHICPGDAEELVEQDFGSR